MSNMNQTFLEAVRDGSIRKRTHENRDYYPIIDVGRFFLGLEDAPAALINSVFDHFRKKNDCGDPKFEFEATATLPSNTLKAIQGTWVGRFRNFLMVDYEITEAKAKKSEEDRAARKLKEDLTEAPVPMISGVPAVIPPNGKAVSDGFPIMLKFAIVEWPAYTPADVDEFLGSVTKVYDELIQNLKVLREENAMLKSTNEILVQDIKSARSMDLRDRLVAAFEESAAKNRAIGEAA